MRTLAFTDAGGSCCHIAVEQQGAFLAHDTDVHGAGMQVDAAVKGVLRRVKSPGGLLLFSARRCSQCQPTTVVG
jgi:hypothetical protein